jgi:hypothetical protein
MAQWLLNTVATIINLLTPKKRLLHYTNERFAIVRGDFVAVVEGRSGNGELGVGVPNDEVGVIANHD